MNCENLFAVHALEYHDLPGYLLGFMVWDDTNTCLHWDETVEWLELLDVPIVRVLYDGIYDEARIRSVMGDAARMEGYVIRVADAFHYRDFRHNVAKFVRANHVNQDAKHWMHSEIRKNGLAK